ncbi:Z1 domain-containing protein [Piscinibacter gummiphilus]|uniref:Endonuclease n=1 Tax=Piscinibacter gummiphilus TaxID=946333 RepID=A0A1W6L349_9BURK|nr:Z1 domain-containing protein [Piscinibacter gummiphilus]ARN18694.1 endonuclease [Piscinibacter gummiphilus]ATU63330.1 endonuclease [Piscinibacter gummiphilus]GLS95838.1 endonuclease [Piscinibacter gummiphilus]
MADASPTQGKLISIAQTLLRDEPDETKRSPTLIAEVVAGIASLHFKSRAEEINQPAAVAELIRRFSHWISTDATLSDVTGHVDWLNAARKKDWRYWHRLSRYMERTLAADVVDALDRSTDEILGLLEDPEREGHWDRRGLVVGHVQSGKTSSYSALICKAADAGYKIIIVLAGLHNNLRSQTQIRLEEAFLGYETSPNRDPGKPLGVFFEDSDPEIHPHCATTREDNGDFNAGIAKHFAISPEERPWLFVIKKNKTVMARLLKWIQGHHVADATDAATGRRIVTKLPLLVIDDESDHASVDTGEQTFDSEGVADPDHQPKAINSLIRRILSSFAKSAYVGYTATPFANIFIHRQAATREEGSDLFPRSFIKNLTAPSNYVGPARVFGARGPNGRVGGLPLTRIIKDHIDGEGPHGWMPEKHKKDHVPTYAGQEMVTPSLREAIHSFLITCAMRSLRGQKTKHASMLVHVTRFTGVQAEVRRQVEQVVKDLRQALTRRINHEKVLADLRDLWERDFLPTSAVIAKTMDELKETSPMHSWSEIEAILPETIGDIALRTINGSAKEAFEYAEREATGLKVIAIGGDKLARGLTLEGLTTSYFVRTTKMYDTLLQMGRWFGYRPGYLDLCRLYTTEDLVDWFGHIADASEELREEFDAMAASGATPEQYGLRVASHDTLLVTSPLKMRTAQNLSLSYSGSAVQTITFKNDKASLQSNLNATFELIQAMGAPASGAPRQERDEKPDEWKRSYIWREVDAGVVIDFLKAYVVPAGIERANSSVMAEFIEKMNEIGLLKKWTVALVAEGADGEKTYHFPRGISLKSLPSRSHRGDASRYSIGALTEPEDEAIDVGYDMWKSALNATLKSWKPDPARNRFDPPSRPNGKALRQLVSPEAIGEASRGLLLLYPLTPSGAAGAVPEDWNDPIMAFAASFPSSEKTVKVEYMVDHLYWKNEYGASE